MPWPEGTHPSVSAEEVQEFLTQFFITLTLEGDREAASAKAKKTLVDGNGIYEVSEEQWNTEYGIQGQIIYNALQRSRYVYFRTGLFGLFSSFVERLLLPLGSLQEPKRPLTERSLEVSESVSLVQSQSSSSAFFTTSVEPRASSTQSVRNSSRSDPQVFRSRQPYGDGES